MSVATSSVRVMRNHDPEGTAGVGAGAGAAILARMAEQRRATREAEVAELQSVLAWADLHRIEPVVDRPGWVSGRLSGPVSGPGPQGAEGVLFLAGPGTSGVVEFAVCQVAVTLSVSERSARRYVAEALELHDRLPRLFAKTVAGVLPVWRARQIAAQTLALSVEAAGFVDAHLADFAHRISAGRVERCVAAAVLHCDPDQARERAELAADARRVDVEDHLDGVSTLTAILSTPDAAQVEDIVAAVAHWLAVLGDTDSLEVRRAKALGLLADPQAVLDFRDCLTTHQASSAVVECLEPARGASRPPAPGRFGTGRTFHVHLHTSAVEGAVASTGLSQVARVEGFGGRHPVSLAAVEQWLRDLAPDAVVRLTPVVDTTEQISVDRYEVPPRLSRQIDQRDLGCCFPWCGSRGRYDLDHIEEYVPPDEGGPPGQTASHNMARLCRFHHRVKTHSPWDYWREPDDSLTWRSPTGRRFRVDHTGTQPLRN